MNYKIIKSLLKKTLCAGAWLLPLGVYFKFYNTDSSKIVSEFKEKHLSDVSRLQARLCRLVEGNAHERGKISEFYRDATTALVPLVAYTYNTAHSFFSEQSQNDESYFKLSILAYIAGTAVAAILKFTFKNACFYDLGEEVYRSQNRQIPAQKPFRDIKEMYRCLESKPAYFSNGVIFPPDTEVEWKNVESVVDAEYRKIVKKNNSSSGCD